MKRKFYLLALVCAVAGTSVISSCKDTDEDLYNDLKNQLASTSQDYEKLLAEIEKLKSGILNGKDGKDGVNGQDGKNAVEVWLDENPGKTEADFWESLKGKDGKDGATIDDLLEAMKIYETKEEHAADINEIKELIKKLQADLQNLSVTSVVVNGTSNWALGYGALPFGVQSNILMAYYSNVTASEKFPTVEAKDNGLTTEELETIGFKAQPYDLTERKIDMGKVYLSINPTKTNFAGKSAALVNSLGEEDGITLSELETCTDELYFGYTRANSGFYTANAKVTDLGAAEKINGETILKGKYNDDIVKALKNAKNAIHADNTNAGKILLYLYEALNNVCTRRAVQVKNGNDAVVSDLSIAAAIVRPIGFKTVEEFKDSKYMDRLKSATSVTTSFASVNAALTEAQNALENVYEYTLPALVKEDSKGAKLVSADPANPSLVESEFTLHVVSYCAETLVPYIMKHVAVVSVKGAADNDKALQDANNTIHMNCILGDHERDPKIELAGLVSGATYEVVYSAMDYAGATVAQRFYFKVK